MRAINTNIITKFRYSWKKNLLVVFTIFFCFNLGYATVYTSTGTSTGWSTGTTWDQGSAPSAATDTVVIQSGHTVILDASPTLDSLAVNGTLQFPSSGPYTFTVRAVSIAGAINATFTSGATLHTFNISGNLTGIGNFDGYVPGGLFQATVISIDFNSSSADQIFSLSGSTIEFYNFTISNSGGQVTTTNSNSTVFGTYSIGGSADVVLGSGTITMAEGNFAISSGATFDANISTIRFTSSSASQQISIDASTAFNNIILNKSGGSFTLSGTTDTLTIDGTFTRTDGSITSLSGVTLQYNQTTGSLTYNGTSSQAVENEWPSSIGPVNVTINNSSGVSTTSAQSIAKTLSLTSGTFSLGSADLDILGTVAGSELADGGTVSTSGTITLGNGTGLQVPQSISGNVTLSNLTINKGYTIADSNVVTIDGSLTLSGDGDLTVTAGTLNLNGKTITGTGNNTLTVSSGATVQTGGSSLSAFDDLVATSGTLEFSGSGSQETLPTDETIGTIIVNNSSNVATASGTLVIADALTFSNTSGIINTTSSNILELESDVTVTGEDDSHYIDGPVTITSLGTSSSFDVPVGDGSELRNVLVTNGTGASGDITVQYETTNPNVGNNPGVKSTSNNRKWTITPAASGIQQFDVQLIFTSPGFTIADEDAIRILRGTSGSSDWTITDDTPTIDTGNDLVATNGTVLTGTSPVNFTIAEVGGAVSWDGEGADGLWNTASNWSGDAVPTSADDVTIDVSGGVTVTIGTSVSAVAQSLTIGDAGGTGSDNTLIINSTLGSPLTITTALTVYDDGALVFNASNGDISAGSTSFSSGSSVEYQQRLIPVDTYGNLSINGATGVSGSGTVTVNANLTKSGGAFTSSEAFTVSGTYTGTAGDATYNGGLTVNGSTFTVNGGSVSGTVTLSGSGTQYIEGTGSEIDFDALTINNSSGLTVNNPISVSGVLTLTDGLVTTSELNLLTIGTSGTISNPSQDFINGPMANQNTSNMFFAIGKGSDYRPVELVNVSGTSPTVRFEMFNGDPGGSTGTGVNNISAIRYWKAQVITGSITCRVELHWGSDDGVDGDTNNDLIVVQSTNGSDGTYNDIGNFSNGTDWVQSDPTSIRTVEADYFTFGSLYGDNSLPVELAAFEALADFSKIELTWTTASENNNLGFNIYRNVAGDDSWNKMNSNLIDGQGTASYASDYSFVDSKITAGETYRYKLESVSVNGLVIEEKIVEVSVPIPDQYVLFDNYPNPFNPTTNIKFQLPEAQRIRLAVYDLNGSLVRTLANDMLYSSGEHIVSWDATDNAGNRVATGIYLYRFQAGKFTKTGKMILVK